MDLLLMWMAIGVAVGWAGSLLVRTRTLLGVDANTMAGAFGALVGGFAFGPMMDLPGADKTGLHLLTLLPAALGGVLGVGVWIVASRADPH